jgi:hypothetical protein
MRGYLMPLKQIVRYDRPSVELEFDQASLTREGCCRFVPVVLRICGVPENTMLTVMFERVRPFDEADLHTDDYEVHPSSDKFRVRMSGGVKGYSEYKGAFLARTHATETGTIHIKLESSSFNVLTEAFFRLDSRKEKPVFTLPKGRLKAIRLLPQLRSQEEREALNGQFPASVLVKELPVIDEDGKKKQEGDVQMVPLFSLEEG